MIEDILGERSKQCWYIEDLPPVNEPRGWWTTFSEIDCVILSQFLSEANMNAWL